VVEPLSADPTVLREDRLGTLLVRAQQIYERGTLTAAFAPAVAQPSQIYTNLDLPSFNPMFDRTNAETRLLLKGSASITRDLSPELLLYREGDVNKIGFNLAQDLNPRMIGYLEWSGGRAGSLIDEAFRFARETGTLPPGAPTVWPVDTALGFKQQLALGASYTTESRITFNLEFHFNQAGFSDADWNRWFAAGSGHGAQSPAALELWYLRDYALDQQEPISRNFVFLRADRVDAFVPKLELTGLLDVDLRDGSALVQMSADYFVSDHWTIGGLILATLGPRRSDFGSLAQQGSVLLKAARYF